MGSEEEKVMYLTYTPKAGEFMEETLSNVKEVEDEIFKREDIDIVQSLCNGKWRSDGRNEGGGGGWCVYVPYF